MPQNCSHWPWIYATDTPNTTIGYSFVIDLLEIWYTSLLFYPSLNDKKAFDFEEREVGVSDSGVCTLHRDKIPQIHGHLYSLMPYICMREGINFEGNQKLNFWEGHKGPN